MLRPVTVSLLTLAILVACSGGGPSGDISPPPPEVQASFKHFADSIIPRIRDTLYQVGYRKFDPALNGPSSAPVLFTASASPASGADRGAGLYEGVIEGEFEHYGDETTHWTMSLHFARAPSGDKWFLLTTSGYPDDGQPRTPASAPRLPPLAVASIGPHFADRREWQSWWTYADERRGKGK